MIVAEHTPLLHHLLRKQELDLQLEFPVRSPVRLHRIPKGLKLEIHGLLAEAH